MEKKMERSECQSQPPVVTRSEDPWLVYSHGDGSQTFYSLSEGCSYHKAVPELSSYIICTCSHGWLVMIERYDDTDAAADTDANDADTEDDDVDTEEEEDDDGGGGICFLWNPVSMNKIMLPQLRQDFHMSAYCCVLTSAPDTENCFVAFASSSELSMMFCQPGDKEWTVQELPRVEDYDINYIIVQAVTCGGKIYAFSGRLSNDCLCIEVETNKEVCTGAPSRRLTSRQLRVREVYESPQQGFFCYINYLESCGEVYRVMIYFTCIPSRQAFDHPSQCTFVEVNAFKLDLAEMVWERVNSLGDDRAFLIGGSTMSSLSCRTSSGTRESRIEANCIYYFNSMIDKKKLYRFNIQERSIAVSLPCPNIENYHSFGPDWIMPHI